MSAWNSLAACTHGKRLATDLHIDAKGAWVTDAASEAYVKNNAYKNPCSRRGARGVWNMGQTCYQSVILQALLHDPTLNAYFLAGGHDIHTCERSFCMACAATEVFMEFNSGEKTDAVSAATLLYHGWDASRVCRMKRPFSTKTRDSLANAFPIGHGWIPSTGCP